MKKFTIKDRIREKRLFQLRLFISIGFILACCFILLACFFRLQIAQYHYYTTMSLKNEIELRPIVPRRGFIYDRNGVLLADNLPVFNLVVTPGDVKNITDMLIKIGQIIPLSEVEIEQFKSELKRYRRFDEIPLKLKLSDEEVATFEEKSYLFPGVHVKADLVRYYPFHDLLAHVVGYVGRINETDLTAIIDSSNYAGTNFTGKTGIEKYYEIELHGVVGYERAEMDASGQTVRILDQIHSTKGNDIYLTIEFALQKAAADALSKKRGAVVAIDPSNGEILAFVSSPSFDPNLFVQGIDKNTFQELQENIDRPLYNRILNGLYPPGSTIKPFIAVEGLESGVVTPEFKIFDPGWYKLPDTTQIFHDWQEKGHGWVNIETAITVSCDTFFYELARRLGINRIDTALTEFGFGHPTGIDMDGEFSGNVPSPEWKKRIKNTPWFGGDTINSGIGQGFIQVTPLQLASAVSIIANAGIHYRPHLVQKIAFPDGAQIPTISIEEKSVTLSPNSGSWNLIIHAMEDVMKKGTGIKFGKTKYVVAGKTGTAQVFRIERDKQGKKKKIARAARLQDNALFIAFASSAASEKPEIALAVVVENEHSALEVARKVLDAFFNQRNLNDAI